MNFKAASFCVLSLSILVQSPNVLAAKKTTLQEIKDLQSSLLKNRNAVDTIFNTKAHQINKETESVISGLARGNYTNKQPLYGAVRQMSLEAVKNVQRDDLFAGADAMENLLKGYKTSEEEEEEDSNIVITNPSEKIYSITVLHPHNLEAMKKINSELNNNINDEDKLISRMSRYIDLSMKGKRYLTYKEAEALSDQIYKMNSDLQEVEELAIKLPTKDQKAIETFRLNMSEWLNKKLIFTEINKKGFITSINLDSVTYLQGNNVKSLPLNKNYTAQNIANTLKAAIKTTVTEKHNYQRWDDFYIVGYVNNKPAKQVISVKDLDALDVKVSEDRKLATISSKKYSIVAQVNYVRVAKMFFLQDGKAFYDHAGQNQTDYFNPNYSLVRAQLKLVTGHEIQMKSIYKNFGVEKFGTDLGKVEYSVK